MMDAGGENYVFWFSTRAQENAFLDTFRKNFVFVSQMFLVQQKSGGTMAPGPRLRGPWILEKM